MDILVLNYGCIFVSVTILLGLSFGCFSHHDRRINERLIELAFKSETEVTTPTGTPKSKKSAITQLVTRLLPHGFEERHRLQAQLAHAGIYSPNAFAYFLTIKWTIAACPPVVATVLANCYGFNPLLGLAYGSAVGSLGLIVPGLWLRWKRHAWHRVITKSLPDFLDLMVTCLEAGLGPQAAFQRITEELTLAHPYLTGELSAVQAQIELGASFEAALENFADRSDCDSVRSIATTIKHGTRVGGSMAEVFRQQSESLRVRRELLAEEKAQQAAVKIIVPTLLFIFPVIFVVLAGPAVIKVATMFSRDSSRSRIYR